jgi:ATP-dependent RNA helicase DeaD
MTTKMTFADLDLRPELKEALAKMGLTNPTEVQQQSLPRVLTGRDLMVQSRTGTGKTLAFVLPSLQRLDPTAPGVQILVIAPTRELANQVGAVFARIGRPMGVRLATLTGGMAYGEQLKALRQGAHVIVGTPGRLNDHLSRGTLDLSRCRTVVLDEADEILDMGFQEDLEKLLGALPTDRQTLLFSATLSDGIERIARGYMREPERLGLSAGMEASTSLTHALYEVAKTSKYEALVNLLHTEQPELAILFCHTKAETESLSKRLADEGFKVGYLNGNLPQALRSETLEAFRKRQIAILVATDVAARGIDVRGITHVVNVDIPRSVETYIHRSGRAGRAGQPGLVLNLITPFDRRKVQNIISEAKLTAEYRPVPQGTAVLDKLRQKFFENLVNRIDADAFDDFREFAASLLENLDATALVAALLQDVQSSTGLLAAGYEVEVPKPKRAERPTDKPLRDKPKRAERPERAPRERESGMTRLRVGLGKNDRMQPGYLVRIICDRAKVKGDAIGAIALFARYSLIDVRSDVAGKVVSALKDYSDDRGRRWTVSPV